MNRSAVNPLSARPRRTRARSYSSTFAKREDRRCDASGSISVRYEDLTARPKIVRGARHSRDCGTDCPSSARARRRFCFFTTKLPRDIHVATATHRKPGAGRVRPRRPPLPSRFQPTTARASPGEHAGTGYVGRLRRRPRASLALRRANRCCEGCCHASVGPRYLYWSGVRHGFERRAGGRCG
jgi:hypothetical protein